MTPQGRILPREPEQKTPARRWALFVASLPLILFILVPLAGLLLRVTPSMLATSLGDRQVGQAMELSFVTTLVAVLVTFIFGTPVAYLLARKRFPGRALLDALIDMPIVLPPAVAGVALLLAFGRRGFLGPFLGGIEIPFTETAVILAQVFVAAPYYVKSAAAGFASVSEEFEQAAAVDGASRPQVLRSIVLPLTLPSIVGGIVMTWARALGEFGATIIFAGNFPGRTQTMPLAIYIGFEIDLRIAVVLAVILLVVSFLVLALVKGALGRKLTVL